MRNMIVAVLLAITSTVHAESYTLPGGSDNVIGALSMVTAIHEDTLLDIGRVYGQGFKEMVLANPKIDAWLPKEGTDIIIPSFYILPDAPREGIVINIPEMRLYYYPKNQPGTVITYPISVGREDWRTPMGLTSVVRKVENPTWHPPAAIRKEHAEFGDILPEAVGPGPDNPLGTHAMYLGHSGYLIHGTDKPNGIGMRVTHGCMRLFPKDIIELYGMVSVGTPVRLVNQPFKLGRLNGTLYLEVHPHLEEDAAAEAGDLDKVQARVRETSADTDQKVVWDKIRTVVTEKTGIPIEIGTYQPDTVVRPASTGPAINPPEEPSRDDYDEGTTATAPQPERPIVKRSPPPPPNQAEREPF